MELYPTPLEELSGGQAGKRVLLLTSFYVDSYTRLGLGRPLTVVWSVQMKLVFQISRPSHLPIYVTFPELVISPFFRVANLILAISTVILGLCIEPRLPLLWFFLSYPLLTLMQGDTALHM